MCARFVHMHRLCSSMPRQANGSLSAKKELECLDQRIRERSEMAARGRLASASGRPFLAGWSFP